MVKTLDKIKAMLDRGEPDGESGRKLSDRPITPLDRVQEIGSADRPSRRSSSRINLRARCWIDDGQVERYSRLVDLGNGGVRISTTRPQPVGTVVRIRFDLATRFIPEMGIQNETGMKSERNFKTVYASGRIIWRTEGFFGRGGLAGIEFIDVQGSSVISSFLRRAG